MPQAFQVQSIANVKHDIFDPDGHIVRWRGDPLAVMEQIDALDGGAGSGGTAPGCGLTFGIQTPIDSRAQALARAAQVGNVYINRNQIGTVVGARSPSAAKV